MKCRFGSTLDELQMKFSLLSSYGVTYLLRRNYELSYNYLIFFYNISSPWRNYELSLNCLRSVLLQSYQCLRTVSLYSSTPLPRGEIIEIIFEQSLNCLAKVLSGLLCLSSISEENLAIYYLLDHLKLSYLCIRTVFILKLKQFCSVL